MTTFLLDQGIPYSTTLHLKQADWQGVHVSEIGMSIASDEEILAYAADNQYTCVTLDADFHALLAVRNATYPSVIRIRQEGLNGPAMAQLLNTIWPNIETAILHGALVTVTEQSLRVHHLPIIKSGDSRVAIESGKQ